MKKLPILLLALVAGGVINAKTLRVNNNVGAQAPYTTVASALDAATDGDVIILEGSPNSYGDFDVTKPVTIQGNGYFLDVNEIGNEGASPSTVGTIKVKAENVKITGLLGNHIEIYGNHAIVTRCNLGHISLGVEYNTEGTVSNCIIHQNFLNYIAGGSYLSKRVSNIQITNNIIIGGDWANPRITSLENCVIKYNTFTNYVEYNSLIEVKNSVIEYNFNGGADNAGSTNTYFGNVSNEAIAKELSTKNDKAVKDGSAVAAGNSGAFAGDDPYVLSGVPTGPRIDDLTVPASVEQGQDLKVTVKISRSK